MIEFRATVCAICGTHEQSKEVYPATCTPEDLNAEVFSARRLPDRIHYRMVRCNTCGLLRSDPVADPALLADLYQRSSFDYDAEVGNLQFTYGRYLSRVTAQRQDQQGALLEIGCGNGFFLQEARRQGYAPVRGVEPSKDAVAKAPSAIQEAIVCDLMRPGLFTPESFDVICLFQVFDHLPEPGAVLDECRRVLKPGGMVLCLNHNVDAISARLLGERSPIVDIEHTYLYSPATLARIFRLHEFAVRQQGPVYNRYSVNYLARLLPLPGGLKPHMLNLLQRSGWGNWQRSVPLGNLYLIAEKPTSPAQPARQ